MSSGPAAPKRPCRHDSTRRDGTLDAHCVLCGADGYWHVGHAHHRVHPSGKVLVVLECPDSDEEVVRDGR